MMAKTRIFISRDLEASTEFVSALKPYPVQVSGKSLLQIELLDFDWAKLTGFNWLFFYSSNGVKALLRMLDAGHSLPHGIKLGCIGSGTAKTLNEAGLHCNFIGTGDAPNSATAFLQELGTGTVLFLRAAQSEKAMQIELAGRAQMDDLVVYQNKFIADIPRLEADILVFTSPLNAQAWYSTNPVQDRQHVIAIGKTTQRALAALNIPSVILAERPDELALAQCVISLLQKNN